MGKIICPKCFRVRPGTKHHVLPRRFFCGRGAILWLCRHCHNEIEKLLPQFTVLHEDDYLQITLEFLAVSEVV